MRYAPGVTGRDDRGRAFPARAPWLCAIFFVLGWASSAAAHPDVDAARAALQDARFAEALAALERAEASGTLSRSDLVTLFELEALAHRGLDDAARVETALRTLAVLDRRHEFLPESPPAMRRQFEEIARRAPWSPVVSVHQSATADAIVLRAVVRTDPLRLRRSVRLYTRIGPGAYDVSENAPARVSMAPGSTLEFYAELIGPGGAVLASDGTAAVPRSAGGPEAMFTAGAEESDSFEWGWVALGGGVLAAGAVALILGLVLGGDDTTQLEEIRLP
jgi:hypothetical protein